MTYEDEINQLIKDYFGNPSKTRKLVDFQDSTLYKKSILIQTKNSDILEINVESDDFNKQLLQFLEEKLRIKIESDIIQAFTAIHQFDELIRNENQTRVINVYDKILNGLRVYIFHLFEEKGINLLETYKNFTAHKDELDHLYRFEKCFFLFLPKSKYPVEEIFKACDYVLSLDDKNQALSFAWSLGLNHLNLAQEIYNIGIQNRNPHNTVFVNNLLVGLYHSEPQKYFSEITTLVQKNPSEGFRVLTGITISEEHVRKIYELIEEQNHAELYSTQTDVLCRLIESPYPSEKFKVGCFKRVKFFFDNGLKDTFENILNTVAYRIEGYEDHRYGLLNTYLSNTQNYQVVKYFFSTFKEPAYLFHLITSCYNTNWPIGAIKLFEDALIHFWNNSRDLTEKYILDLFDPKYKFGLLPIEIILSGYSKPFQIDLLKLNDVLSQIKAIESFCRIHHSFEKLLPILLELRKSKFRKAIKLLQKQLGLLVFESYHHLYDEIEKIIDPKKERNFLLPIKKAKDLYEEIKKEKEKFNDLNPLENERDLIDLYYRLEGEGQAKLMKQSERSSFLGAFAKNVDIIRGHCWKQELDDEVRPLSTISVQQWIDTLAFKNPDLYEFNLKNFDK